MSDLTDCNTKHTVRPSNSLECNKERLSNAASANLQLSESPRHPADSKQWPIPVASLPSLLVDKVPKFSSKLLRLASCCVQRNITGFTTSCLLSSGPPCQRLLRFVLFFFSVRIIVLHNLSTLRTQLAIKSKKIESSEDKEKLFDSLTNN